jgi:NitT/TauT family transport system permease protein
MENAPTKTVAPEGPPGSPAIRRARLILALGALGVALRLVWFFVWPPAAFWPGFFVLALAALFSPLSLGSAVLGMVATFLGARDLRRMRAGLEEQDARKVVLAGYACGVVALTFFVLWVGLSLWFGGASVSDPDKLALTRFLIFAVTFVVLLTLIVRIMGLRVRSEFAYTRALVLTAAFVGLFVAVWWFITAGDVGERIVQQLILPSPVEVLKSFKPLHVEQGLVRSAFSSWVRVTMGFSLAALVAIPLGVYMATFPPIAAFFRPLSLAGAYVPIVVFIPLSMTWFGIGEAQKIGFLFIGCFVALLPLVIKDIADVPAAFLDVAVTKGATQWQLVRHVLFPVAQANVWDHCRGVYGVGWGWIIMAEVLVRPEYGLGGLIDVSNRRSQTGSIWAIIIVIVVIAIACDQLWKLGGELLFPYRKTD